MQPDKNPEGLNEAQKNGIVRLNNFLIDKLDSYEILIIDDAIAKEIDNIKRSIKPYAKDSSIEQCFTDTSWYPVSIKTPGFYVGTYYLY